MKTISAYTFKLLGENKGRTQKVQDDRRTVTTGIHRGVPGCGPRNFQIINYLRKVDCAICYVRNK